MDFAIKDSISTCNNILILKDLLFTEQAKPLACRMLLYIRLDRLVQIVSFSEVRENFKAVLDRVTDDADVTLITRRNAQSAVVMSLDMFNSLMETVHLLRTPANAAHLQRSLDQFERGELLEHPLLDVCG